MRTDPSAERIDLAIVAHHSERIIAAQRDQSRALLLQGIQLRMGRDKLARVAGGFDCWLGQLGMPAATAELLIRCSELFHGEWIDHLSPAAALLLSGPDTPPAAVDRAKPLWRKSGMMSYADARQLIDETNRPRTHATPPAASPDPAAQDPATEAAAAQLCDPGQRRLIRRLRPG